MQEARSPISVGHLVTRTRITWLAGIAGVLIVIAAICLTLDRTSAGGGSAKQARSNGSATSGGASSTHRPSRDGAMNLGIAYGATPKDVLRQLGSPTTTNAHCWVYRGRAGNVRDRYSGPYVDALKFCFSAGPTGGEAVTQILSHTTTHTVTLRDFAGHAITKKRFQAQWGPTVAILKVPDWYGQESS